jgi:hypothetical protein
MKALLETLLETARGAGPYLLVELLLPGGTLIAVLLWLWRNRTELGFQRRPEGSVIATGSLAGKVASSA